MRWPRHKPQNRGTLTLMNDCWIVGIPSNVPDATRVNLTLHLNQMYPDLPPVISFPFPVDVHDMRTR